MIKWLYWVDLPAIPLMNAIIHIDLGGFLIVVIVVSIRVAYSADKQEHHGMAMEGLSELFQPDVQALGVVVINNYREPG